MRYKNDDDNRYRVRFMRATEEIMDRLTVSEFIIYLKVNAELEDETWDKYSDGHGGTKMYKVVAWMPQPELYRKEKNNE